MNESVVNTIKKFINDSNLAQGITNEMVKNFNKRTDQHVQLVIEGARKLASKVQGLEELIGQAQVHDESKYKEPEYIPYVWLTEYHRCKNEGIPFEYPEGVKEAVDKATLHHILNNAHHPESHDVDRRKFEPEQYGKDRDNPDNVTDATLIDRLSLAEMVCDWYAMSKELGTSLKEWSNKVVNKRWMFVPHQVEFINKCVEALV